MARYIDADALIEMLNNKAKTDLEMGLYNHHALTESFIRFVERQPTADVVPITEIADFIWQGESEKMNFPFDNRYYNKQEFIAELKKKYTEGEN